MSPGFAGAGAGFAGLACTDGACHYAVCKGARATCSGAPDCCGHGCESGACCVGTYGLTESSGGCVYDGLPLTGVEMDVEAGELGVGRIRLRGAMLARHFAPFVRPALINGAAGVVAFEGDTPFAILAFTVVGDRAIAIDVFNDRELVPKLMRGK